MTGDLLLFVAWYRAWLAECKAREMAERRLKSLMEDRARRVAVGQQLVAFVREGRALRRRILQSGDHVAGAELGLAVAGWLGRLLPYLCACVSPGKAEYVHAVLTVQESEYVDVKNLAPREAKAHLLACLDVRLERLISLLPDF